MPKAILIKALIFACTAGAAAVASAAESGTIAAADYRLRLEQPGAYRFTAGEGYVPAREPRSEPAPVSQFADRPFAKQIDSAAHAAALDPALVHAVISVESGYNAAARSPKGAIGLMQVLPATAARYGVADPGRSPEANLRAGTRYLSSLMELFDNRVDLVLAAYNAGENAVLRYGERVPPYRETQLYVPAVLAKYREWREPLLPQAVTLPAWIEYLPGTRLDPKFGSTPPAISDAAPSRPSL